MCLFARSKRYLEDIYGYPVDIYGCLCRVGRCQVHDPYGNIVTVDTIGISLQNVRPNTESHQNNIDLRGITHRLTISGRR